MAKQPIAFPADMGPVEREIIQRKWDGLTNGDLRVDTQILARHLDKVNARLDEIIARLDGACVMDAWE